MIAANRYVNAHNDMYALSDRQADFQQNKAFNGVELVHETHRLALMNAYAAQYRMPISHWGILSHKAPRD